VNIAHYALVVFIPILLFLSSLVNVILIGDLSISAGDGNRNEGVHSH
jgi:hypothetical protein